MQASVIFPAYKSIGNILENVEILKGKDVEFIVAGDCLCERDISVLKEAGIKLVLSSRRRGKVQSVNDAAKFAKGEFLIFIDADTKVLSADVVDEILRSGGDFGGGTMGVSGKKFFERMVNIDILLITAVLKIQSLLGVSSGLHGAFFFMRKRVFEDLGGLKREIVEDVDLGIRASEKGYTPVFIPKKLVHVSAPGDFRSWFLQRKRWAVGGTVMAFRHFGFFVRNLLPTLFQLFILFPQFFFFIPLFVLFGSTPLFPLFFYVFGGVFFVFWVNFLGRYVCYGRVPLADILLYYVFYGPVWGGLAVTCFIYVILKRGNVKSVKGWKV